MYKSTALVILALGISGAAVAQQKLSYVGDFESGQIQKADRAHDGFFLMTLPSAQVGSEFVKSGAGGFGPDAKVDTRVVRSEMVGTETVFPRSGDYFARSALYFSKNYIGLNGDSGKDKARSGLEVANPVHLFDYDAEGFFGFSIYVPRNYEHETGSWNTLGAVQLMTVKEEKSAHRGFFSIRHEVRKGESKAHWWFHYTTSATSTEDGIGRAVDMGPVEDDLGKWTDFVIRFRENPFSVATNPAARGVPQAKNQTYEGNKGILQVWKAEGPIDSDGKRKMSLKVDLVNTPVGLVPHATGKRMFSLRIYKYGWKRHPTSVKGPIWFGFDEIRLGFASKGVGYSDVAPSGQACGEECNPSIAEPKPPRQLQIN